MIKNNILFSINKYWHSINIFKNSLKRYKVYAYIKTVLYIFGVKKFCEV